jgi:hypothetical protein
MIRINYAYIVFVLHIIYTEIMKGMIDYDKQNGSRQ